MNNWKCSHCGYQNTAVMCSNCGNFFPEEPGDHLLANATKETKSFKSSPQTIELKSHQICNCPNQEGNDGICMGDCAS